jgi:hypothetical protein
VTDFDEFAGIALAIFLALTLLIPHPDGADVGDYRACGKCHQGGGVFTDEQSRGMINVESIGGNLIVQHYRPVRADRASVEMYSPASRVPVPPDPRRGRRATDKIIYLLRG